MSKNFYISDLHFGHKNILRFDSRPFNSIKEMEEKLISNWNSVVSNNDIVYHLGDFCWGKADEWCRLLDKLNGNKVMIKGNHDLKAIPIEIKRRISDIKDYKEIDDNGKRIIMSHYPILTYKHSYDPNTFMFYGHTHLTKEQEYVKMFVEYMRKNRFDNFDNRGQLIPVGCMMLWMDYTPRTADYLIDKLDKGEIWNA